MDSHDARHVAELLEFILEQLEQFYENLSNKTNSNSSDTTVEEGIYDHILMLIYDTYIFYTQISFDNYVNLLNIGGSDLFLQTLRHEDETVRVLSLQIISHLHVISKFYFPGYLELSV